MNKVIYFFFLFTSIVLAQAENQSSNNPNSLWLYIIGSSSTLFTGLLVGYFVNKWNNKAQKEHYTRNLKDEQFDKWSNSLKNCLYRIVSECSIFYADLRALQSEIEHNVKFNEKHVSVVNKFNLETELLLLDLRILLSDNSNESKFYKSIVEYCMIYTNLAVIIKGKIEYKNKVDFLKLNETILDSQVKANKLKIDIINMLKSIITNREKEWFN